MHCSGVFLDMHTGNLWCHWGRGSKSHVLTRYRA